MEHIFRDLDAYEKQQVETWDRYRAGETAGGMLRPSPNPFLVQEAIRILTKMRKHLKESGFDQNIGSFLLKKLYGTDHDGEPPAAFTASSKPSYSLLRWPRIKMSPPLSRRLRTQWLNASISK